MIKNKHYPYFSNSQREKEFTHWPTLILHNVRKTQVFERIIKRSIAIFDSGILSFATQFWLITFFKFKLIKLLLFSIFETWKLIKFANINSTTPIQLVRNTVFERNSQKTHPRFSISKTFFERTISIFQIRKRNSPIDQRKF